jgi:Raf kinase inhibitor-like YbhB/YbcL family protein
MIKKTICTALTALFLSTTAQAGDFELTSSEIQNDQHMSKAFEFMGFGCKGDNRSPELSWKNAPEGTKSFALTVHDPDAPTGSGWWHWQVINIPVNVTSLKSDAGNKNNQLLPNGAMQIENDYGYAGFGGACPPEKHGTHHYHFNIHALSVANINLPENASGALTGYMINANTIEKATLTPLYERP